jgi:cytochrome c biogenesis protein CcmG, thiol:disulfide interchange protein DsbE
MSENISVRTMAQPGRLRPNRFLMPFAIVIVFVIIFGVGLSLDPSKLPSPLIGKPVPVFTLPPVRGRVEGLSSKDLEGEVSLLNVFASWCTACRDEHPLFMRLRQENILPIYGLNYRDRPEDAAAWLDALGDPYARTGADINGRVGIDWGVYGVPETYVVDRHGRIAYKHIGAIDTRVLNETLLPLIESLREQP